jgi:hypothetical protein
LKEKVFSRRDGDWTGLRRHFRTLLARERGLPKPKKTAAELQKIIREASAIAGPWPKNMSVIIYSLDDSWRIIVSYSDPAQTPFRDRLMEISRGLTHFYDLDESV